MTAQLLTEIEQRPANLDQYARLVVPISISERDALIAEARKVEALDKDLAARNDMLDRSTEERAKLIVQLTDHVPVRDQLSALAARAESAEARNTKLTAFLRQAEDRAESSERKRDELKNYADSTANLIANIGDTLRSRDITTRPMDEGVIALAQQRDSAEQKLRANQVIIDGGSAAIKALRGERDELQAELSECEKDRDGYRARASLGEYASKALLARRTIAEENAIIAERDAALAALNKAKASEALAHDTRTRECLELVEVRKERNAALAANVIANANLNTQARTQDFYTAERDQLRTAVERAREGLLTIQSDKSLPLWVHLYCANVISTLPATTGSATKGPVNETCAQITSPSLISKSHLPENSTQSGSDSTMKPKSASNARADVPTGSAGQPGDDPDAMWLHGLGKSANIWHNPSGLSRDQIGTGYRPLTVEEAKCVPEGAECWYKNKWLSSRSIDNRGRFSDTYRIRTTTPPPLTAEPVSAPQGKSLDWTVERNTDAECEIWTPDITGACIGSGATEEEAKANAAEAMRGTILELAPTAPQGGTISGTSALTGEPVTMIGAPQGGDDATPRTDEIIRKLEHVSWYYEREAHADIAVIERSRNEARRAVAERDAEIAALSADLQKVQTENDEYHQQLARERVAREKSEAAETTLKLTLDRIYNHNKAARAAVIQHYGIHHKSTDELASPFDFAAMDARIARAFEAVADSLRSSNYADALQTHFRAVAAKLRQSES